VPKDFRRRSARDGGSQYIDILGGFPATTAEGLYSEGEGERERRDEGRGDTMEDINC